MKQFGYGWGKHKFGHEMLIPGIIGTEKCVNCGETRIVIARNKLKCKRRTQ